MLVVDTSALGCILLPDEHGPATAQVRAILNANTIAAPHHWPVEMASMIRAAERRGRITEQERQAACATADGVIAAAHLHVCPTTGPLVAFAHHHKLTVYDASFVYLARTLNCAILTFDAALSRAAAASGIELLRP